MRSIWWSFSVIFIASLVAEKVFYLRVGDFLENYSLFETSRFLFLKGILFFSLWIYQETRSSLYFKKKLLRVCERFFKLSIPVFVFSIFVFVITSFSGTLIRDRGREEWVFFSDQKRFIPELSSGPYPETFFWDQKKIGKRFLKLSQNYFKNSKPRRELRLFDKTSGKEEKFLLSDAPLENRFTNGVRFQTLAFDEDSGGLGPAVEISYFEPLVRDAPFRFWVYERFPEREKIMRSQFQFRFELEPPKDEDFLSKKIISHSLWIGWNRGIL